LCVWVKGVICGRSGGRRGVGRVGRVGMGSFSPII